MSDPLSINSNNRDDHNNKHRVIVDRNTLVPIGVALAAGFLLFQAASEWTMLKLRSLQQEERILQLERKVNNVEASQTFWRREVERKLGPLPDYQPSDTNNKKNDHTRQAQFIKGD